MNNRFNGKCSLSLLTACSTIGYLLIWLTLLSVATLESVQHVSERERASGSKEKQKCMHRECLTMSTDKYGNFKKNAKKGER